MKAVVFHAQGGIDQLRYEEAPDPTISASEILVKVFAALSITLTFVRVVIDRRCGLFRIFWVSDIAGQVAEVGAEVRNVAVGDSVVLSPCIPCGTVRRLSSTAITICATLKSF